MNLKQLYFPDNLTSAKKSVDGKNGSSKSSEVSAVITENHIVSENHYRLRIKELEDINSNLKYLADQQEKELIEVIATNNKYISIISHDLRSPFASIVSVLEIIKESLSENNVNQIENLLTLASNSAIKTITLLDNLLAWTISQNKENSFHPVKINLFDLIVYEIESVQISTHLKQILFNHCILPDLNVSADLQMVKTILRNLINNAVKFTNPGGEIIITASERNSFVEITIKDTGIGISPEAQRKLFNMDVFKSIAGTNGERGTGLGLLLCKDFIELHGGNIWIESEPGKGSEFKFTLPHYI